MQRKHEEEQQLQAQLEKAVEIYHIKCATQKTRKLTEAKTKKEAKKWRLAEEEKIK